ncbi:PREDICTED: lysosome-associated membrane glycoprotein 5 [Tinamus guttatus]|nr:PREDICTED: lysosome-associated membrane glycoprotein 5 [Tinamus guttatus]
MDPSSLQFHQRRGPARAPPSSPQAALRIPGHARRSERSRLHAALLRPRCAHLAAMRQPQIFKPGKASLTCCLCSWAAGKHTASSHRLSAFVTPAGKSYECQAQQTITLVSSDHQKSVELLLSEVRVQPFDISADFVFSEEHKCPVDQREQLEETLPLILGLILGLVIVITLCVYHVHHKLTASQVQIPRDRSQYKHMG